MTAVYGYVSKAKRRAVLATDDKKAGDPGRVEKIVRVDDRFVAACYGQDTPIEVLRWMAWHRLHTRDTSNFDSKEKLLDALLAGLGAYVDQLAPCFRSSVERGEVSDAVQRRVGSQQAHCVILDCEAFELVEADLGSPLPQGNLNDPPLIYPKDQDQVVPFAGAVEPVAFNGPLLDQFAKDPKDDLATWMSESHAKCPEAVGCLGAWVHVVDKAVKLHPAFSSAAHALGQPLRPDFRFVVSSVSYEWSGANTDGDNSG